MHDLKWWQKAVFYQIYPRSFADSNGDGIGDLSGIIQGLDYIQGLGVDAIWLSPHYPSPLYDVGYDIADYQGVAPEYGSMQDFKNFLQEAHRRGLRVILDLVLNHTSDQHPWFIESRSSLQNPRRDWYIWEDGKNGGLPNNWFSYFGGPAWELDQVTGQYYYHFFFKQQPDLNWRNPAVKQALFDAARFWLEMGVDGFRLDAIGTLYEDPTHSDSRSSLDLAELYRLARNRDTWEETQELLDIWKELFSSQHDLPEIHDTMRELRAVCDEYNGCVLVGETDDLSYHGSGEDELHMVFNFPLMRVSRLTPQWVRANQKQRLTGLPPTAWPCNTLGNHDTPRVFSRYADGEHDDQIARLSLALMLTLRGTPFLYNGEEIGMTDYLLLDLQQFKDNLGVWAYHMERDILKRSHDEALQSAILYGRDKNRTPMQWRNAPNAGFSPEGVQTWLPVNPDFFNGVNVADQDPDPDSLLNYYRRMLRFRKETPVLISGGYTPLHEESQDYLAFLRGSGDERYLVILNMSDREHKLVFDTVARTARVVFSSRVKDGIVDDLSQVSIAPYEVYVARLHESGETA